LQNIGVSDALKLLNARIGTPAAKVLDAASVRANKSILAGRRVEDVLRWAQKKMTVASK
jgi:hypothetical protein